MTQISLGFFIRVICSRPPLMSFSYGRAQYNYCGPARLKACAIRELQVLFRQALSGL